MKPISGEVVLAAFAVFFGVGSGAQAGVTSYDACVGAGFESRVMATFKERFPHEACSDTSACPSQLLKSAEALTRSRCRAEALAECASAKCALGLESRWTTESQKLRLRIDTLLSQVDFETLPPLKARRLSDETRWFSPSDCLGDETTCAAAKAGVVLGDLERVSTELAALE